MKTRRRLELLLEDLPCDHDPSDYYETSDQLLEPLLLCYESLVIISILVRCILLGKHYITQIVINDCCHSQQSCGSGAMADGRLADLIRRVATFGMVLMKLDLRQVSETISLVVRRFHYLI